MGNPIAENATKILVALYENNPEQNLQFDGNDIHRYIGLTPQEINYAIDYLDDRSLIERLNYKGTAPYHFGSVSLNSRGNYVYHEIEVEAQDKTVEQHKSQVISQQPLAAGSPFGFTDLDWEYVQNELNWNNSLKVVLGYQFKSTFYDTDTLMENIKQDFEKALKILNKDKLLNVKLNFKTLSGGYGEHLFNQITREIISSDIAVFETSDLNPNVMIEMGVALTWGKRVLPIKQKDRPVPPSDISGQTYANYSIDGAHFESPSHMSELVTMLNWAIQKKMKN